MQENKNHLPSLFTLIVLGASALMLFVFAAITGIASAISLFEPAEDSAGLMIGSVAFSFEALLTIACGWFVLQKTRRLEIADQPFRSPFAAWQILAIIFLSFPAILIGSIVSITEIHWLGWLVLPILTLLIIFPVLWVLTGIGVNGIELGPRWRLLGIFGISMTLAPFVIILIELVLMMIFALIWVIALAAQPEAVEKLLQLQWLIENAGSEEAIIGHIAPYLQSPYLIATVVLFIAVLVPLIEEAVKPLALWVLGKRIESNAQGFALGLLCGGGFGLIESLNASADGTTSWAFLVSMRAGTTLLHMVTSGLVGWGIANVFREKRYGRLIGAYLSAVLIHGLWNACAIGLGFSSIGVLTGNSEWLFMYAPGFLCGLIILGIGIFALLIASNKKVREQTVNIVPDIQEVK